MHELKKKIGKVLTSKSVGTGPSSYENRIYRAAVSQKVEKHCSILSVQHHTEAPPASETSFLYNLVDVTNPNIRMCQLLGFCV